jgi:hypothetical protein
MSATCTHLDQVEVRELPAQVDGCEDCLAWAASGSTPHLPDLAATSAAVDNVPQPPRDRAPPRVVAPLIRSIEPGEDWSWCYVDDVAP